MFRAKSFRNIRNTSACAPLDDVSNKSNQRLVVPPSSPTLQQVLRPTSMQKRSSSRTMSTAASSDVASVFSNAPSTCSASMKSSKSHSSSSSHSSRRKKQQQGGGGSSSKTALLSDKMGTKQEKQLLRMVKSLPHKARDDLALQATSKMKIRVQYILLPLRVRVNSNNYL